MGVARAGPSAARAFVVGHRGGEVFAGSVVCGLLAWTNAFVLVPSFGVSQPFALWAIVPPTLAALSGVGVADRLAAVRDPDAAGPVWARAGWTAAVTVFVTAAAAPCAATIGDPALVVVTSTLVLMTYASAAVVGVHAIFLGLAIDVLVVSQVFTLTRGGWTQVLNDVPIWAQVAVGLATMTGVAAYIVRGCPPRWG